jgi:hypothetical protein
MIVYFDSTCTAYSTGVGSSINNKVYGHLEDRWATISSRCPYTLLLIELPIIMEDYPNSRFKLQNERVSCINLL